MAQLQIVFGQNPISQTKRFAKSKKIGKLLDKEKSGMKSTMKKRLEALAKARRALKAKRLGKKRKNPTYFKFQKGNKKAKSGAYLSRGEIEAKKKALKYVVAKSREKLHSTKGAMLPKAYRKKVVAGIKRINKEIATNVGKKKAAILDAAAKRAAGWKVKKVVVKASKPKKAKKAKKSKKVKMKKVSLKKVDSRKGSDMAKKKHKVKKGKKKVRPGKRYAKRRIVKLRPGKSVTVRARRNPVAVEQYIGMDVKEAGGLVVGGAIYGVVNRMAATYAPQVYSMAARVPVLGTTLVPLAIGVALRMVAKKVKALQMLELVGDGLIGASIVGMGINASQYVPGLSTALSGVDFTPGHNSKMNGYASSGPDFGRDPGNPDFGNVDYTPAMNGAPQLGMQAQLGSEGRDPGNPDFGLIPEGLGEMGLIPEGLGGLA